AKECINLRTLSILRYRMGTIIKYTTIATMRSLLNTILFTFLPLPTKLGKLVSFWALFSMKKALDSMLKIRCPHEISSPAPKKKIKANAHTPNFHVIDFSLEMVNNRTTQSILTHNNIIAVVHSTALSSAAKTSLKYDSLVKPK